MSAITIRAFRANYEQFRHILTTDTDEVFLQHYNYGAEKPEDAWENLLRYDPDCYAWNAKTGKMIGHFHIRHAQWFFIEEPGGKEIACNHTHFAESLLDSEVDISKHWLSQQQEQVQ